MLHTRELAKRIYTSLKDWYRFIKTDVFIISFPKSGRTWLRVLIGKALRETFGLSGEDMLDTHRMTSAAGILRSRFTHDRSSHGFNYLYSNLPADKSRYRNKKVISLCRIGLSYYEGSSCWFLILLPLWLYCRLFYRALLL